MTRSHGLWPGAIETIA